jgi:hypothetical protein
MKTIFDLQKELNLVREINPEAFAIEYFSKSNPFPRHSVVMRNDQEFHNLKEQSKEWDFVFNVLAI